MILATRGRVGSGRGRMTREALEELWRQGALLVVLSLVPLTFVGITGGGYSLAGLAWVTGLLLVSPLVLTQPLSPSLLRRAAPYLVFVFVAVLSLPVSADLRVAVASLVQLTAPLLAFLLAARVGDVETFLRRASRVCQGGIVLAVTLTVLTTAGLVPGEVLSTRPMAISLVVLFVIASLRLSPARSAVLGAAALTVSVGTGGRTSSAVLLLVLILSPAFRLTWRGRAGLAMLAVVGVVLFSQTAAFQERFFFGGSGTLTDALTGSEALNTAGRRELWPRLVEECSSSPALGLGIGAGSVVSNELTLGVLSQPHNDFLRTYCDVGLLGAIPFWSFFFAAGFVGYRLARRGNTLGHASGSLVLALLALAVTDNPIVYTAHFMMPLGIVLGLAARADSEGR